VLFNANSFDHEPAPPKIDVGPVDEDHRHPKAFASRAAGQALSSRMRLERLG
jgi:hypothetical protein